MAEPFAKPTKEQMERARELYGDPVLYWATNTAVEALRRMNPDFDVMETLYGEWLFITRRLLWRFGLYQVVSHVYRLEEEDVDEYWKNWTPPQIKIKEENQKDPSIIKIKDKLKISFIARKYKLKKGKGKNMWICPFHNDKNPSLNLSDEKGVFHCFGCNTSGDIIKFLQLLENGK